MRSGRTLADHEHANGRRSSTEGPHGSVSESGVTKSTTRQPCQQVVVATATNDAAVSAIFGVATAAREIHFVPAVFGLVWQQPPRNSSVSPNGVQ